MATQISTTTITENNNNNKVHQFLNEVESHKRILENSTNLFTTLSNHYSSLQKSLSEKSNSIDFKLKSLQFNSTETLDSLVHKENIIPERETAAVALIEEQKDAALAELQKPLPGNIDISAVLKSLCRRMDSTALLRFIVSKRKESALLRSKISAALAEAVDSPRLVLEAVEDFLNSKSAKSGATDKRWACGILIQAMVPESGAKGVRFSRRIAERALEVVERWKGQMDGESGSGAAEAVMFLQMVVCFGLRNRFDEEYLRKSVMQFASRRDMAKLAATLEFGDKMIDIIDELVKNGKEVEAVYFASESGLTERFPPVDLLKSFIRNCRKNASAILKKGNNRQDDSYTELNSIKALIKCVEDHKLESEINLDSLRRRITQLEKNTGDRKKSSASGSKPPNKHAYGTGRKRGCRGSGSSRPEKAAKFSSYPSSSPSFSRRSLAPSLQLSPATRYSAPYNYPSHTIYDGSTANPYAATYGTHIQTPAGLQQHYSLPVDNLASSGYPSTSSYAMGQTSYGGVYDYGNAAPPSYQNQTSYMG
ncbi:hypothetical protein TanjilG_08423 [Lupinus angustifolius]|uniref:FRIGIDA-like protein n=1 Tax=Lupinus angustifolius TaxID=3871 RepID=A0A394DF33_LUPAN|nr:PREDICTED: FRIGIDA-like protein 4b [Lupinus angustifolius]OIW21716.1 hypothetical protein TanjilG_08423 [Lupinus angustifolius]